MIVPGREHNLFERRHNDAGMDERCCRCPVRGTMRRWDCCVSSTEEIKMILKSIAVALVSTALMTGATFAQTATKDRSDTNVAVHRDGEWRSSKLIGVDVYN